MARESTQPRNHTTCHRGTKQGKQLRHRLQLAPVLVRALLGRHVHLAGAAKTSSNDAGAPLWQRTSLLGSQPRARRSSVSRRPHLLAPAHEPGFSEALTGRVWGLIIWSARRYRTCRQVRHGAWRWVAWRWRRKRKGSGLSGEGGVERDGRSSEVDHSLAVSTHANTSSMTSTCTYPISRSGFGSRPR